MRNRFLALSLLLFVFAACGRSPLGLGEANTVTRPGQSDAGIRPDAGGAEICDNGVDDNGDGRIDCADPLCLDDENCQLGDCPSEDIGDALGDVWQGDTSDSFNQFSGGCGGSSAPEISLLWTAPESALYRFSTEGAAYDTLIYLRDGTCAGPELDCNDDTIDTASEVQATLSAGQSVLIFIDGFGSNGGFTPLRIEAVAATTEICFDGLDNDGNGLIDCDDPVCFGQRGCERFEDCVNGIDDDGNGLVDCDDPACFGIPGCGGPDFEFDCFNGIDDDFDGLFDCADPDCQFEPGCGGPEFEFDCFNGFDDDGDGQVDCLDEDCAFEPFCQLECPAIDLGSEFGDPIIELPGFGTADNFAGSCGGAGFGEFTVQWRAPFAGAWRFETQNDDPFSSLYVLSGGCEGREVACDTDGVGRFTTSVELDLFSGQNIVIVVDGLGAGGALSRLSIVPLDERSEFGFCSDGLDNDRDGFIDCRDPDCTGDPDCASSREICTNGIDDDFDRLTDCDDPDCQLDPFCASFEDCDNGFDDDFNGLVDCDDPSCFDSLDCLIDEICQNGVDDDRDGRVDCFDPDCIDDVACRRDEICTNAFDDDRDGLVDCEDPDCNRDPFCIADVEVCDNGVDDDRDGFFDCDDVDCIGDPACETSTCPRLEAGSRLGLIASGDTSGQPANFRGSCGGGSAPDDTVRWTAPAAGSYTATTAGSAYDTVLYALFGSCGGDELACDDDTGGSTSEIELTLRAGQSVVFVVDGFGASSGEWELAVLPVSAPTEFGLCDDGIDNDDDGPIDCEDADCASDVACVSAENCRNGIDDDGDGAVDCEDTDCEVAPFCVFDTEICDNGEDDDRDGAIDCDDVDCRFDPACLVPEICFNGIDDDGDRRVDCDDPDCAASPFCETPRELCTNGVDDDRDGAVDCEDPDCAGDPDCAVASCPAFDLGRAIGVGVGSGVTVGGVDTATPSCARSDAPDVSFRWRAPSAGTWVLDTSGSDYDTILHVRSGTCDGVEVACDDDGINPAGASQVIIDAARNETFILFVDGWGSSSGDFLLNIQQATPDSETGFCADGDDNDGDGRTDCADPDCFGDPNCGLLVENCSNGRDDDFDGRVDCADDDCFADPACGADPEVCFDGEDNDGDGLVDCDDPDCADSPACFQVEVCDNGFDDDRDGDVDCEDPDCDDDDACRTPIPEQCSNGVDDDLDGRIDCGDTDCFLDPSCFFSENCSNGRDDDGDGLVDCADPSCVFDPVCESGENCSNGRDDDGDGLVDCDDPECLILPECLSSEDCTNDVDDDGDGLVDCEDLTCLLDPACQIPEDCTNGFDDDDDGETDCDDSECADRPICATSLCPNGDLGSRLGTSLAAGSTSGADNDTRGRCGGDQADDVGFTWTAPNSGRFAFDTDGSTFDTVLYVLEGDACDEDLELACDDDGIAFGGASQVVVELAVGETVTLIVDGFNTSSGSFVLNARRVLRRETGRCDNGVDDDVDGDVDCDDTDCAGDDACVIDEICFNGVDDDGNGRVDCDDPACFEDDVCLVDEICSNGEDDDRDGQVDCDDPDCDGDPACAFEICDNGLDDDGDRRTDCFDPDCFDDPACAVPEDCSNGFDDDGDGETDCEDVDCSEDPACLDTCPDIDLGSALGAAVSTGSTAGRSSRGDGSCAGGAGPDITFVWQAPENGRYQFDTFGSSFDTQLHIRLGGCDGEELVCDDDTGGVQSSVELPLVAGTEVVIFVDGFGTTSAGDYVLNISRVLTTEVGACTDGVDNDSDGAVDCNDPDCDDDDACIVDEVCFNGFDDDRDGLVDCDDPDCDGFPTCGTEEVCDNGIDDDLDGATDCDDPSCDDDPACSTCPDANLGSEIGDFIVVEELFDTGNRDAGSCGGEGDDITLLWQAPAPGRYRVSTLGTEFPHALYARRNGCGGAEAECAVGDPETEIVINARRNATFAFVIDAVNPGEGGVFALSINAVPFNESGLCANGIDDDGDGQTDCADGDCEGDVACLSDEVCTNGADDDGDGRIDCDDSDCADDPSCFSEDERCDNGFDDDGDGLVDCADTECIFTPECIGGGSEDCGNGLDDDGDGQVDCADPSCSVSPDCFFAEDCSNGIDDDGDGQVDCDDLTCSIQPECFFGGSEDCDNGVDDDGDGQVDCDDTSCVLSPECLGFPLPFP